MRKLLKVNNRLNTEHVIRGETQWIPKMLPATTKELQQHQTLKNLQEIKYSNKHFFVYLTLN